MAKRFLAWSYRPIRVVALLAAVAGVGVVWALPVPTTLDDFFTPGTQPAAADPTFEPLKTSSYCRSCHPPGEPTIPIYERWEGSMMAHSLRDPVFQAAMTIANQDAVDVGDMCIRCHSPLGWIGGRSVPTDGSALTADDRDGVTCNFCHRLVDPVFKPGVSPAVDQQILADLTSNGLLPPAPQNGSYILDPQDRRRGPFDIIPGLGFDPHPSPTQISPFHTTSELCGTCHDVANPAFTRQPDGSYALNALGAPHPTGAKYDMFPLERTYSEWSQSAFAAGPIDMGGRFGGNNPLVSTCQDCHMPKTTAQGCVFASPRTDLPMHDFTGGSTWVLNSVMNLYPQDNVDSFAIADGIARAQSMLSRAASLSVQQTGCFVDVQVTNETGHKLPTGFPEGRRVWLNVRFLDAAGQPIAEHGSYDVLTATLDEHNTRVYETLQGVDADVAGATGLSVGPTFHVVLNNVVVKDNRIPPRGFSNAGFASVQAAPVRANYADGQYWDDVRFHAPPGSASVVVTLYYQSTTKEYIEFLRDQNITDAKGQLAYDEWVLYGQSAPVTMASQTLALTPQAGGDYDGSSTVDLADHAFLPGCLQGPDVLVAPACQPFDCDNDGDVDAYDNAAFNLAYSNGL
ncbi:MAG: multiheme c-type cytochrome [Phycisphaerae bacterium]